MKSEDYLKYVQSSKRSNNGKLSDIKRDLTLQILWYRKSQESDMKQPVLREAGKTLTPKRMKEPNAHVRWKELVVCKREKH